MLFDFGIYFLYPFTPPISSTIICVTESLNPKPLDLSNQESLQSMALGLRLGQGLGIGLRLAGKQQGIIGWPLGMENEMEPKRIIGII